MAIRHWTPRTIGRLWIGAAVLQGALFLPWVVQQYRWHQLGQSSAVDRPATNLDDQYKRLDSAERATLTRQLDSFGIALEMRGDTLVGLRFTPQGEAKLGRVMEPVVTEMSDGLSRLWPLFIAIYLIVFAPTLVALTLTVVWLRLRKRREGDWSTGDADALVYQHRGTHPGQLE